MRLYRLIAVPLALALCAAAPSGVALPGEDLTYVVAERAPAAQPYRWPLDGAVAVVRPFAPPPERWLPGHRGVDLGSTPGAPVSAAGAGTVHFAGRVANRGVVSIEHPNGLRTTYEPVEPTVTTGQELAAGAAIGVLAGGHAGCPGPACLHWGLRDGDRYLDPLALLGRARMRLLPSTEEGGKRPG